MTMRRAGSHEAIRVRGQDAQPISAQSKNGTRAKRGSARIFGWSETRTLTLSHSVACRCYDNHVQIDNSDQLDMIRNSTVPC